MRKGSANVGPFCYARVRVRVRVRVGARGRRPSGFWVPSSASMLFIRAARG